MSENIIGRAAALRARVALLVLLLLLDTTSSTASLPPLRHTVIVDEAGEAHLSRRSPSGAGQGGTVADAAADAGEERGPTVTLPITLGNIVSVCVLLVLAIVGAGAIHSWGQRPSCSCRLCQGAYTVTRHLGKGGFGAVYEVKGTGVQVPLVMKKIAADSINRANEIQQESKVLRELHHRHVVKHHDDFLHVEEGSLGVGAIFVVIVRDWGSSTYVWWEESFLTAFVPPLDKNLYAVVQRLFAPSSPVNDSVVGIAQLVHTCTHTFLLTRAYLCPSSTCPYDSRA